MSTAATNANPRPSVASAGQGVAYPLGDDKRFTTARARAALRGVALMRTHPADGPVKVFFEHAGRLGEVRSLDDLEGLL